MINFSRVEADIFIGSAPKIDVDVSRLKQTQISAVLSLQSDNDLNIHRIDWDKLQSIYQYNGINMQRFQINDFDEVDLANKLTSPIKALNDLLNHGHRVYVHCNAGICHAPATVLGYLCHFRGVSLEDGLAYIRENRPQANPYTGAVSKALRQLAQERQIID